MAIPLTRPDFKSTEIVKNFESKCDLDLTCCMQSPFPPRAQEKSHSHVEQKTYISPFFDLPNKVIFHIPGISDRSFLAVLDK